MNASAKAPSLAQRIALFSAGLLVAFILALGSTSWLLIRSEQGTAQRQLLDRDLQLQASRIGNLISTLHGGLADVARSSLISTALVDSLGKEAYLIPYLQGLRRVDGIPLSLAFTDFEGKEIARNGNPGLTDADFDWLRTVLADPTRPTTTILGRGDNAELRVAELIYYSRTKTPEGALVYRLKLSDLSGQDAPLHWFGDGFTPQKSALSRTLTVPAALQPLRLGLSLHDNKVVPLTADRVLLLFLAMTILAIGLAIWATRRIAEHVTRDLKQLSGFATDVIEHGLGGQRASPSGTRDIRQLADAINSMLDRLKTQHEQLQQESEAKFRSLVENMPGAAYQCDALDIGRLDYVSPGIEDLTGYPPGDFIHNTLRSITDIVHPDDRTHRQITPDSLTNVWEYRIVHASGESRWIWERNHLRESADGQSHYLEGVLFDISERKNIEQTLLQAKGMAESANLAKTQFLATMSHELRTPMSGILGMAQLLMAPDLSTTDRLEYTRTVLDSGQILLVLLNDILDLSRIEAGRLEIKESVISPERLCQDIAALFSASARRKHLQVNCRWHGPVGQAYLGDSVRLRQMLSNLLSNAVKFTDEGQIDIEAREVQRVDGQATLEFSITDTGIGIEDAKIALLFQPFSQLDTSNTRRHGGSGLGLSIVQNLALLMGGSVGVEARPGEGSRFWFRVRATPTTNRDLEDTGRYRTDAPVTAKAAGFRVMVVEDNPVVRKVVEAMLTKSHLHISAYANGQEALAALSEGADPQVVLMDCHMPVMDGFAATQAIRKWERAHGRPRVPIVALTAGAFEQDREKCIAAGMDDFLPKPVALADLLHAVDVWARIKSTA